MPFYLARLFCNTPSRDSDGSRSQIHDSTLDFEARLVGRTCRGRLRGLLGVRQELVYRSLSPGPSFARPGAMLLVDFSLPHAWNNTTNRKRKD